MKLAWLVVVAACGHSSGTAEKTAAPPTNAAPVAAPPAASAQVFDGIAIGASFAAVKARTPYDSPCDSDRLDREPAFRAMIYAGSRPCHHAQFPEGTSVVMLVEGDKIAAFGWMGGTYYDNRSGLPIKVGEPIDKAVSAWGQPVAKFDLQTMHVARFSNGLRVMSGGLDQIVGFAVGDLPDDPAIQRWQEFDHMYAAYTQRVGGPATTDDECRQVAAHLYEVEGSHRQVAESDIADCRANNTPEINRCILGAKTKDAVSACFAH